MDDVGSPSGCCSHLGCSRGGNSRPPALLLSVVDRDGFHALVFSAPLQRYTVGAIKNEHI